MFNNAKIQKSPKITKYFRTKIIKIMNYKKSKTPKKIENFKYK